MIIIWEPQAKLAANNNEIQELIKILIYNGVKISACKACADELNVTEERKNLNIEVIYWGEH